MDIKDLEAIIAIFEKSQVTKMDLELEGASLRLEKDHLTVGVSSCASSAQNSQAQTMPHAQDQKACIEAPLVGIFHAASEPGAEPFVKEGQMVQAGAVVGIGEAMKTMNEITASKSGVVKPVLVKEGDLVEFGQALMELEAE